MCVNAEKREICQVGKLTNWILPPMGAYVTQMDTDKSGWNVFAGIEVPDSRKGYYVIYIIFICFAEWRK